MRRGTGTGMGKRWAGFAIVVAGVVGCARDEVPITPPSIVPVLSAELAANPAVGTPKYLPELDVDLPPAPRPWEQSDSALADAVRSASGRAFIGLKSPATSRVVSAPRLAIDSIAPAGRFVLKGRRSALSAADAAAGLNMLAESGVNVLRYYENIGVAHVEVRDPAVAARLRTNPRVDYLEPDIGGAQLDVVPGPAIARLDVATTTPRLAPGSLTMLSQTTPWGISLVRAPDAWPYATGSGSRMLVIDTGHERGHEDLPVIPLANCMGTWGGCTDPVYSDPGGVPHGTHVSGAAVALNNGLGVVGVAYGVPSSNLFEWAACDATING